MASKRLAKDFPEIQPGDTFGSWKTIKKIIYFRSRGGCSPKPYIYWLCRCGCRAEREVQEGRLLSGTFSDCKCPRKFHGCWRTRAYTSWSQMKSRCSNPNTPHYHRYGGRGIKVCDRWKDSFQNFLEDMGQPPGKGYTLDRMDNNGDYTPENCRWATKKEQARNTQQLRLFTINGETRCLTEWCEIYNAKFKTVEARLKYGWDILNALIRPNQRGIKLNNEIRKKRTTNARSRR